MAAPGIRIHPAWWSPRLFPYVVMMGGLSAIAASYVLPWVPQRPWMLMCCLPVGLIAVLFVLQRRLCRIVLLPDTIVFPQWRGGDTSEMGVPIYMGPSAAGDGADRVTMLAAGEIVDWIPEPGRIVLKTRVRGKDAISLSGIRPRDRARILDWLTEKVGA